MNQSNLIILTFIVTGLWDVVLRIMAENYEKLPSYFKTHKFIRYLIPYFKKHTLLAAALIAAFVGATTQFIISGLYGFIMKWSKLFPHLEETYYKQLGHLNGAYHDGVSGLIVQVTLLILLRVLV